MSTTHWETGVAVANSKKNVVLVHGILTDGSVWRKVIPLLQQGGLEVTAAQIPNSTLEEDIGTVRRTLDVQEGPVILVGHSYAGMVISGIGKHEKVERLVYIAALAPDENETVAYLMSKHASDYTLEPISDEAGWLWPPHDAFTSGVAQDADPADLALLWAARKSWGGVIFSSIVSDPAWKTKPSWYLAATGDRMLHIGTQRFMASRMNAQVHEIASSHLPQMAHPEAVAKIIFEAAEAA
jgi:pimeloyl-ACP methyl ester carboxylesterase